MITLLDQIKATDQLASQLAADRLPHALIFTGPPGVGKHTTAVWLAERLLCLNPATTLTGQIEPCGNCDSCRLLARISQPPAEDTDTQDDATDTNALAHPDLHLIHKQLAATSSVATLRTRKQTNLPIDLLREHVVGGTTSDGNSHDAPAYKSPTLSNHKIFVIDEAELIDPYGQNALLKTLEEPPANTTLILVTANEDRLLPTIRSRCQRIAFAPLSPSTIERWLNDYLDDPADIPWLSRFAAGSLGRAKIAADHHLAQWGAVLEPQLNELAQGRPAPSLGRDLYDRIQEFAEQQVKQHRNASKEAANRAAAALAWSILAQHAHHQLTIQASQAAPRDMHAAIRLAPWAALLDAIHEAEGLLTSNVNLSLICDDLAAKCAKLLNPLAQHAA